MIDTLRFARRMEQAGIAREQAEAIAEGFADEARGDFATKQDLAVLKAELEAKIEAATASLVKWFAGVMIAQGLGVVAATVTLVKLLPG